MKKVLMIEWQPYLLQGFNWWVYEYYNDAQDLTNMDVPTSRLVGRYKELPQAQAAHPQARFSDNAQKAIADGWALDPATMTASA